MTDKSKRQRKGRSGRPAHRQGDVSNGAVLPSLAAGGSPNVTINGRPAMRQGDLYADGSLLAKGSRSVTINGRPAGRIFDALKDGGVAFSGSLNVSIGDEGYSLPEPPATACQNAQQKVLEEVERIKNAYDHTVKRIGRGYTPRGFEPPLMELGKNTLMPSQYIDINRAITESYKKLIADAPNLPWVRVGHVVAAQFGCNMSSMHTVAEIANRHTHPDSPDPVMALIFANNLDDMVRAIGEGNIRIFEGLYPTMRLVADLGIEKFLDCAKNGHFDVTVPKDLIEAVEELQKGNFIEAEYMIVKYEQRKIAPPIYREFRRQYEDLEFTAKTIKKYTADIWDLQSVLPLTHCAWPMGTSKNGIAPISMDGSLFNEVDRIRFYQKLAPHIYKHYGK